MAKLDAVRHSAQVLKLELSLVSRLCESIDTPRSLTVALLIKYREFDQLADLEIDPDDYLDARPLEDDYLVTSILSKNPRLPVSCDPEKKAIEKFWEAEKLCEETNSRLCKFAEDPHVADPDVLRVVLYAQQYIQQILGPLTRSKIGYAEQMMRFGPGATTSLSGVVTQGKKYSRRALDATPRVLPFRTFGFPELWKEHVRDVCPRRSSKMRVVPKKATCGRTICIEPDLNIFVQLGQGALIRKQLADFGLDLNTQVRNQELARAGSLSNDLCTMDLSSASDLISREVVWLLLPYTWADFLHFSRVDFVEFEGRETELHKWSSMGNGYTFELETLIFYSILLGCLEVGGRFDAVNETVAYGDDLIFPSSVEPLVRRALNFLGFKVNARKTFGKGNFRESCGTDWFLGHNVRPFFLKSQHHDFPTTCFIIANGLRRLAHRRNNGDSCDVKLLPAWLKCYSALDKRHRFRIPEGFGDCGLVSNWDEAAPSVDLSGERRWGWGGFTFHFWEVKAMIRTVSEEGAFLAFLNGNLTNFSLAEESIRGRFGPPRTRTGYVLTWPNLGPWQ